LKTKSSALHTIIVNSKWEFFMKHCDMRGMDYGPNPYVVDVEQVAVENQNFREAIWTGTYLQMTLMSIPVCGEIGLENHPDTDQFIRIEHGSAIVNMGECKDRLNMQKSMCCGDAVFIPAGTWHNIINTGGSPLKVSSIYAPPHHPRGTVQRS
jgi:mannose-6-phosphate isomerase-like protein (cupin superfamily)